MVYSIQFLRYVAATLVVLYHGVIYLAPHLTDKAPQVLKLSAVGAAGVHVFFVISGFVMVWTQAGKFGQASPWSFFKRRIMRIYPLYWLLAAINIPILAALNRRLPDTAFEWIGTLTLWPSQASTLIFVGWTLSYEMFFYAIFAGLLALQWRLLNSMYGISLALVALVITGQLISPPAGGAIFVFTNTLLLEFLAGAWIAWWFLTPPKAPLWVGWLCIAVGVCGFAFTPLLGAQSVPTIILWGGPSVLLVFGAVHIDLSGRLKAFFARFEGPGDASYALYLVHPIILPPLALLLPATLRFGLPIMTVLLLIFYIISFVLSVWINRYIEKRLLHTTQHAHSNH